VTDSNSQQNAGDRGLPSLLNGIDNAISRLEAVILAGGVLLMALNTCINVVARFGFGKGLFFSGELNRILIILITFAGIGYAARHGRHIRMSAFYDALPLTGRRVLMISICLVTSLVMFFLCYYSTLYVHGVYEKGRILPALGMPVWIAYVWVPIGFAVTGIQYALTGVKNLSSQEVYLSTAVVDGYRDDDQQISGV
jgi:TRAP-type C4-dicarboxylate transport system permease small subunit